MVYLYMNNQRARVVTYPSPDINDIAEVNAENIQQSTNILLEGGDYQIKSWKLETIGNNSFLVFNYYYKPLKMDYPVYFLLVDNQMYVFLGLTFDSTGLKENQKFVYGMIETVTIVP